MIGFNIDKTIQAAAYLIKRNHGNENYMRLLKLLYIAERISLKERFSPICGDTPYAMERGPVMSATLDLIKGRDPLSEQWDRYIERVNYDVRLLEDPGNLCLSRAELNILDRVAEKFRLYDEWSLVRWCHRHIPEYEKAWSARGNRKRIRIPLSDIMVAIGRPGSESALVAETNEKNYFAKLFGDHMPTGLEPTA